MLLLLLMQVVCILQSFGPAGAYHSSCSGLMASTFSLFLHLWLLSVIHLSFATMKAAMSSHEHKLMKELFAHYDSAVRPRYNSSETVMIRIRFSLQQLNDLDEKRQTLKMSGWLTAEWEDEFLVWDPSAYGGLTAVVVEPKRMWVPKLAIGNSANRLFDGEHYKRFWITVRSDGSSRWQPGGVFAIACALDMNFYPFDDQTCNMEIETWVYTADKVNLTSSQDTIGLDTYIPHGEWEIITTQVKSVNMVYRYYLEEQFPEVYFTIFMRRKYTFYFMYILLPCLMLSGVLLMIFLLPADSGEKVSLGVSILVAISVFLLLVAGNVPDTSDAIPIIAIYLTYFMMVTTLSVAFSVLVIKLHYKSEDVRPPQWLRVLVFRYVARAVCLDQEGRLARHLAGVSRPRRDATWSETVTTEDVKSQNSMISPDGGPENYELLHQRRRMLSIDENNHDAHDAELPNSLQTPMSETRGLHLHDIPPTFDGHMGDRPVGNEWKKIAEVLDRFFFYLFLFFIIVPTTAILGGVRLFKPAQHT